MNRQRMCLLAGALAATMTAVPARSSDPPVDEAGPLVVRIEGPGEVSKVDTPVPVRVVLENRGGDRVRGTVSLGVIDRWSVEPAGAVAFEVDGKATTSLEFRVTAGAGTYDALYPIHAYARFSSDGQDRTAHPILIVRAKPDTPPRPEVAVAWEPFAVPPDRSLALWQLPARRAVVQVFGQQARTMPVGWLRSDEATGASVDGRVQDLGGDRREVVAIHPPWRGGNVGTALVEFPLMLPDQRPMTLRFEHAVIPDGTGDGVTFRVRALPLDAPEGQLGEVVYERHGDSTRWGDAGTADLGRFAGRAIRLQLESHPGPGRNTSFDQSYWAEPTLVAGSPAPPSPFPPMGDDGSIVLGTTRGAGVSSEVRIWPGSRGLLDTIVGLSPEGGGPLFFRGFEVRVGGARLDDPRSPITLTGSRSESIDGGVRVHHNFDGPDAAFVLVGELAVEDGVLRARFRLVDALKPGPWRATYLEDVAPGRWSRAARQVYAGHGNVVRGPGPFSLGFDGHRLSTSFVGVDFEGGPSVVMGVDVPPSSFDVRPGGAHYALHAAHDQTITIIPAGNAFDGARQWHDVNGLGAAGGVEEAAGRFVFDLWGGGYAEAASSLRRAFRYGLGGSMVIWHDWQRWGYDYRLPDIYPPNPQRGTEAELEALIAACTEADTRFALHDNYSDFYPDADGFSYEQNIAFSGDGRPVRAWFNEGRDAQSYRYRADRAAPFLRRNLERIRENLAPTAYFIDVWSSIRPYDYWTADGAFFDRVGTRTTWGELFDWIREYLGDDAPQISESGHDQLIGRLDGATTNHLRVGEPIPGSRHGRTVWDWECEDAERTPWFDVAHHDRFVLHGAGYPSRYEAGLDRRLHGIYSDDYIATEVLTGHPAMVSEPFGYHVVRKHWLLNDLMRALALRRIEAVEYDGDDLHRQHVRWSGGGEVWVNRGAADWEVAGQVLPQYGFLARVPTDAGLVEAAVVRRDGLIVESSRAPGRLYVNGRGVVDGPSRIRPQVVAFEPSGGRGFALTLEWEATDPIPPGYAPFLHFCDDRGAIVFQASQDPAAFAESRRGTIRAEARGTVPEGVGPGSAFELRVGLYDPRGGPRLRIAGADDGESRIRLGTLRLGDAGPPADAPTWTPIDAAPDPILARQNPEGIPVVFGPVTTAGGVRVARDGATLVVTPLPRDEGRAFDVRLRPSSLPWPVAAPTHAEALAEGGRTLGREPLRRDGDALVLTCQPGAFQYRLVRGE